MMDIAELHIAWLVPYVRKSRDFSPLIDHLNNGAAITDDLRTLLADILAGVVKASSKKKTLASVALPGVLKREVNFWTSEFRFHAGIPKEGLRGTRPAYEDWDGLEAILVSAGYRGTPETKGQCTDAAKKIVCWHRGLTPSQLDELLQPRAARPRKAF